ncbi:hypothetical protein MACH10_24920 [Thalassospira tepidiphila]|uniref:phytanoyl-CoA dioxygenase family protein n=1 Tax=Thalassospira tepidiphila TaxID=393657 RepID=UPI00291DD895|nr:hypothetical protein MACH10_24920 [Thalassospira tepidiphila]
MSKDAKLDKEGNYSIVNGQFECDGYLILRHSTLSSTILELSDVFTEVKKKFDSDDVVLNRNLIKRFADCPEVARIFSSPELEFFLKKYLYIEWPVFCGPIVSHYTSNNMTGNSFGLPFHQDYPSMGSSKNAVITWFALQDCSAETHSLSVIPGKHKQGVLSGEQGLTSYEPNLLERDLDRQSVLEISAGDVLIMSCYLPHKTYVNHQYLGEKLSLSRRFDDLNNQEWVSRRYENAYGTTVDRTLWKS